MHPTRHALSSLTLTLTLLLGGCLGKTPPSQFYLLEPLPATEPGREQTTGSTPLVALAPVRIPQYVDRPQIVRAVGTNAYRLDELNRWAEALDANIGRVLNQNLSALVPAEVVPMNASNRVKQAQYRLSVTILEFHVDPQGQARVTVQWQITHADGTVLGRKSSYRAPASVADYRAMVEGLNQCISRLSQDIAATLRQNAATAETPAR